MCIRDRCCGLSVAAGDLTAVVLTMHRASARTLHDARRNRGARHDTVWADVRGALRCVVAIELAMVATDDAASGSGRARQHAVRAAILRALRAEIMASGRATVAANRAAAIHAVARLVAAVPIATQITLVPARAFAVIPGAATAAGIAIDQAECTRDEERGNCRGAVHGNPPHRRASAALPRREKQKGRKLNYRIHGERRRTRVRATRQKLPNAASP